jgi:adenylate cyclase class IV|tara:strand:- start:20303 stop:20512 length:210 start_codon:yes stop_codon:yes gene_type:complete
MDILDILDKKVKDTVEAKVRLEEKLVNLNKSLERLGNENRKLRAESNIYYKEVKAALDELEEIIRDFGI